MIKLIAVDSATGTTEAKIFPARASDVRIAPDSVAKLPLRRLAIRDSVGG
jgi:hypothetical protein